MRAQNEVCIFTYGLREDIFSDDGLIVEAIKFLNKHGARLKIAFKDTNPLSEKFLKSVFNASTKGKVDMWDASKNTQKNDSYFWLNDRHCFARGPQNDIANFGNKEAGQVLNNLFTGIIMKAERVFN